MESGEKWKPEGMYFAAENGHRCVTMDKGRYLQRWPSARSMKRVRQRVNELTGSSRDGAKDVGVLIDDLNPVLRGWGNYHCTGNASRKFQGVDWYVNSRLTHFMLRRTGHRQRAASVVTWTPE